MGKIFEALYGGNATPDENGAQAVATAEAHADQYAARGDSGSSEVRNIAQPLHRPIQTTDKWRRDMKKVASNLVVQADPEGHGGKVVMFSAITQKSGNTTVTEAIARILSSEYSRHRVLILDFSPSKSALRPEDTVLGMLDSGCDIHAFFNAHCNTEEGVIKLPVGATGDYLSAAQISNRLRDFINEARKVYDWVLFDVPPFNLTPLSDSLGRIADGVVLVVNSGVTRVPAINAIEEDMIQLNIRLYGIVLNFRKYPIPKKLLRFL